MGLLLHDYTYMRKLPNVGTLRKSVASLFEQLLVECRGEWQVNDDSIVDGEATYDSH